ncbi:MAG: ribonuclease III [Candidatus Paceibacterota bacterium]|jgi:ribonuclease-3
MANDIRAFQKKIGFFFHNEDLLNEALTHRSYLNENPSWRLPHNERLEFLGDAVLELVVTEFLYGKYPHDDEGRLTSIRAALVNYVALAKAATEIDMGGSVLMSKGEARDTGKAREVILANAFEALLGALYLDGGYRIVGDFIRAHVLCSVDDVVTHHLYRDAKSSFQEYAQEHFKITPTYVVLKEEGPDHRKVFTVSVFVGERKVADGQGYSKQEAEVEAAKNGLYVFKETGNKRI